MVPIYMLGLGYWVYGVAQKGVQALIYAKLWSLE